MKKFILSFSLIFAFLVYAFFQRQPASGGTFGVSVGNGGDAASNSLPPLPRQTAPSEQTNAPSGAGMPSGMPPAGMGMMQSGAYRDGTYTGSVADAYYGNVQVRATVQNGKITSVQFLQYPSDRRTSMEINAQAMPYLQIEAIQAQSAQVDIVSGATQTSGAFRESLSVALAQAK